MFHVKHLQNIARPNPPFAPCNGLAMLLLEAPSGLLGTHIDNATP
jgi:hypothetical protein